MNSTNPFLKAEKICFAYKPGEWVLKDVSVNIAQGSLNMVMGASGSGKTTLLKVLGGFLTPQQGKVFILGDEIVNEISAKSRSQIGYIPQQLGLVRNLTVLENVLIGALSRCKGPGPYLGIFPKAEVALANSLLDQLGIAHKTEEKLIHLSGGERQRVAIARTLMQKPTLVLADEFVSDLDLNTATEILNLIRQIGARDKVTFIMNMHELSLVKNLEGSIFIMKDGRIVKQCRGSELDRCAFEEMIR
jgi:phosphonate transport system ATP-binding protein